MKCKISQDTVNCEINSGIKSRDRKFRIKEGKIEEYCGRKTLNGGRHEKKKKNPTGLFYEGAKSFTHFQDSAPLLVL